MQKLWEFCMQQINLELNAFKNHYTGKNSQCQIITQESLNTDDVLVLLVEVEIDLEDIKMKKEWKKFEEKIRTKIRGHLSKLEIIEMCKDKCEDKFSYTIMMFK